jgi:hypothetical protein
LAPYAFSITKMIQWRGANQEYSNVYHFDISDPNSFDFESRLVQLRTQEVPLHATDVSFVKARAWGPTGQGPSASQTQEILDWTGISGSKAPSTGWYKELAFMIFWPLGRYGERNRPQFLRKWLHTNNTLAIITAAQSGSSAITTTPADIATYISNIANMGGYCTEKGRTPISPGQLYPYLEHRQLGR